jgi:hypothetical protein
MTFSVMYGPSACVIASSRRGRSNPLFRHSREGGNLGDSCHIEILASSPRAQSASRGPRKSFQYSKHLLGSRLRGNDEFFFVLSGMTQEGRLLRLVLLCKARDDGKS